MKGFIFVCSILCLTAFLVEAKGRHGKKKELIKIIQEVFEDFEAWKCATLREMCDKEEKIKRLLSAGGQHTGNHFTQGCKELNGVGGCPKAIQQFRGYAESSQKLHAMMENIKQAHEPTK